MFIGQCAFDFAERKEVVYCYIWTMGKAIAVEDTYIASEFSNHLTIARVINYHMFHNKVPKQAYMNDMKDVEMQILDLLGANLQSWKPKNDMF